jgi:hypothetical protein
LAAIYLREEPDALRSARPGLCGGHRATGVPTAITSFRKRGLDSTGRRLALADCTRVLPSTELGRSAARQELARQELRIVSGQCLSGLETRAARNVVIVTTATKLARICWAVRPRRHRQRSRYAQ